MNPEITTLKKSRDMSDQLNVRLHQNTSFLAFAWNGNLHLLVLRKDRLFGPSALERNPSWIDKTVGRRIGFGWVYIRRPFKGAPKVSGVKEPRWPEDTFDTGTHRAKILR
jgi:hypothetical protein